MREKIQRAFSHVRLSDDNKKKLLKEIEAKATLRRARLRWVTGAAALITAATVLTAFLLAGRPPQSMAEASGQTSAQTSAMAGVQSQAVSFAGRIVLSINPSVEFHLGEDGMVVEVVGLNDDGVALIEGIDFAGLSLENATIVVVNRLIEQGYISASMVDDVYISVTGSTQPDTLAMMSTIIKTAASQYELAVDTVQTGDNELQVVLGETDEPTPTPGEEPTPMPETTPEVSGSPVPTAPADPTSLPAALTLRYLKDFAGGVDDIYIDFNGERVNSDIDAYIDIAGMPTGAATFWAVNKLIAEGYITDQKPDTKVEFDVSAFGEETAAQVRELVSLMMQEAGLALAVTDEGDGHFCLAASGLPAPKRTARYTLREIDDPTVIKVREDITELQMRILSMAFTEEEIEYMLTPRYWAVMPNIIGLDEARAVELMTLAGFKPIPSYWDSDDTGSVDYGEVFFIDAHPGGLAEVGSRIHIHVRAHSMPVMDPDNLPSNVLQYLPTFLDETGHATVTVDRDTGMGVPIAYGQEGYDVVIHAFGGGWKNADGSGRWNEQYITTGLEDTGVYWAADNGDGDDIPIAAALVYEIYKDGVCVACVAVALVLQSPEDEDTLTYSAFVFGFGEGGPYSFPYNNHDLMKCGND